MYDTFISTMSRILICIVAPFLLPAALSAQQAATVPVTAENFVRAETDLYFSGVVKNGGFGKFDHTREPTPLDKQSVIRLNRDTLYSAAVFDLDAGPVTITMPQSGGRFMSLQVIDQDQYTYGVFYEPGKHTLTRQAVGTRYVVAAVRTLADPSNPSDLQQAHALQDMIKPDQADRGRFEIPAWDQASQKKVRDALLSLATTLPDTKRMFGRRDEVDPVRFLIGAAQAWGGNPSSEALYLNVVPTRNDGKTAYTLKVRDVPVDGFWSISVYNSQGYYEPNALNAYSINNLTAKQSPDGSVVIQFGACDKQVQNCLPIMKGWNYMVRLYRPRPEILEGRWTFPEAQVAQSTPPTAAEVRSIAADAYVYLYPMVQNYQTIYQFALNPSGPEFKGPMNTIYNVARVFTPKDTTIVTANSDTPYSYLMLDLRTEPYVVTLPKIEANRYYSLQLVDLYTHNIDYLGTRKDGNEGAAFLIAGPEWRGDTPPGIKRVIRSPTSLMFGQFRTQLFDSGDLAQLQAIQSRYKAEPLSAFLKQPGPAAAPTIAYPAITQAEIASDFWRYANFLLQWAPPLPGEESLRDQFSRIGVQPGGAWPPPGTGETILSAIAQGAEEARQQLETETRQLKSSAGLFGNPTAMAGKYKERALGALGGIYGNDIEETFYAAYQVDKAGDILDTSRNRYTLTFSGDSLPPVAAFWSVTMYDARSRLMVENPIDRYLINSPMLSRLKKNPDGGITLHIQRTSPGAALENNWLPAPDGPMSMVLRMYLPKAEVLNGTWTSPPVEVNRPSM